MLDFIPSLIRYYLVNRGPSEGNLTELLTCFKLLFQNIPEREGDRMGDQFH
jgi:hypothetical protein